MTDRIDVRMALALCGLDSSRRRTGPCLACGATSTKGDSRPPLVFGQWGWQCVACGCRGDGLSLVGLYLGVAQQEPAAEGPRVRLVGRAFMAVLDFVKSGKMQEVKEVRKVEEPKRIDPSAGLKLAVPLSRCSEPDVLSWLASRKIPTHAPAGCLKGFKADWWPWAQGFPLVVPACTGSGEVVSMHARSVTSNEKRWPRGAEARELLFAPPALRAWMRGECKGPPALVIAEGLSDYLTWSSVSSIPAIGIASGGASALRMLRLEQGCQVFVGTDPDRNGHGDRYAEEVADAIKHQAVARRLPLDRVRRAA